VDTFRQKAQLLDPDPRLTCYLVIDEDGLRPRTFDDHYAAIEPLVVNDSTPEDVRVSFEVARDLLARAWHNVRLTQDAERRAYATVEMALRLKLAPLLDQRALHTRRKKSNGAGRRPEPLTLRPLLDAAIDEGLLTDVGFRQYHRIQAQRDEYADAIRRIYGSYQVETPDPQAYTRNVAMAMSKLRNDLSHGSTTMHPWGRLTLELCCDIINQLYPN
jgi:hypothetical protein